MRKLSLHTLGQENSKRNHGNLEVVGGQVRDLMVNWKNPNGNWRKEVIRHNVKVSS